MNKTLAAALTTFTRVVQISDHKSVPFLHVIYSKRCRYVDLSSKRHMVIHLAKIAAAIVGRRAAIRRPPVGLRGEL